MKSADGWPRYRPQSDIALLGGVIRVVPRSIRFVPDHGAGRFFCRLENENKESRMNKMKWTGLNELREQFLSFFESKGHTRLPSYPLVPIDD